jgi:excisionase family DNA binding protein
VPPHLPATYFGLMHEHLSTKEMGWVLGRSQGTVRDMIREGELQAVRIVGGFRIPRAEALRAARDHVEVESGRRLSERQLERLIDEVIESNEDRTRHAG